MYEVKNKQCSCQVGLNKNFIVLFMYYHITVKDEQVKPVYTLVPNNDYMYIHVASNFPKQCHPWIKHWGYKNEEP